VKAEVPVSLYQIDLVLENIEKYNNRKIGIEISDPITKQFRSDFTTPSHRIRDKILKQKGYHMIEIDTHSFSNFDALSDSHQSQIVKEFILSKLNS
jgi:hypothetical protein